MMKIQTESNLLGIIQISGENAAKFLQGQITCDVNTLTEKNYNLAAHCDPKGRVQLSFHLLLRNDYYYLILPRCMISHLHHCFDKYLPLYKIQLSDISEQCELISTLPSAHIWTAQQIETGFSVIYPETKGLFTPHHLNYPALGVVSFNKGCYVGQEIVARMHYLGAPIKKNLYRINFAHSVQLKPGTIIYAGALSIGKLLFSTLCADMHYQALACLQTDQISHTLHLDSPYGISIDNWTSL